MTCGVQLLALVCYLLFFVIVHKMNRFPMRNGKQSIVIFVNTRKQRVEKHINFFLNHSTSSLENERKKKKGWKE